MDLTQLEGYELLGRFRLGKLLGQGGYGAVFEAEQISVGRRCAVKILQAQQIGAADNVSGRFRAEAVVTSRLAHPNTVVTYDFGHDPERDLLFLAMEFLEGRSLHELLEEEGALEIDVALHIVDQIASSLQDAHEQGVIHRDLKPHNVMILRRGADDYFVKVIDFGIAKLLSDAVLTEDGKQLTMTGVMIGTPHYMAPEQIRGQSVDGRADVYALGHCIYKLLTGRTCFQGGAPMDIAIRQLSDRPLPLRALRDELDVSSSFERVVLRALEKEREARWPTMLEFTQALRETARAHRRTPPEPVIAPMRAEDRTHKLPIPTETALLPSPPADDAPGEASLSTTSLLATPPASSGEDEPSLQAPTRPLKPSAPLLTPALPPAAEAPEPDSGAVTTPRDGGTLAMPTPIDLPAPEEPAPPVAPRPRHPTPTDAISMASALPLRSRSEEETTGATARPTSAGVRAPLILALVAGLALCVIAIGVALNKADERPATPEPAPSVAVSAETSASPAVAAPALMPDAAPDVAPDLSDTPDAAMLVVADMATPPVEPPDMGAPDAALAAPEPSPAQPVAVKKQPKSAPSVELQVVIVPYGELYMDGKRLSKGTRMSVTVPLGKHTFEARDKGVRGAPRTLDIGPGFKDTLRLSVQTKRDTSSAPKPIETPKPKTSKGFDPNQWSVP
jgi:eukaryotic-like serine/threonine-protein kinase